MSALPRQDIWGGIGGLLAHCASSQLLYRSTSAALLPDKGRLLLAPVGLIGGLLIYGLLALIFARMPLRLRQGAPTGALGALCVLLAGSYLQGAIVGQKLATDDMRLWLIVQGIGLAGYAAGYLLFRSIDRPRAGSV